MPVCAELADAEFQDIYGPIKEATGELDDQPIILLQKDFDKPYIIDTPGYYKLGEDIKLNFYPRPYDIFDVKVTGNDLFGFAAGIKITAENVILDLSGHAFYQSPQDFCVQRFFALIQLNNSPFEIGKGPIPQTRLVLESAKNVLIRNGTLGLSSHQAILGNSNENILLENIKIRDFEVTGVTLNNVTGFYMKNTQIQNSIGNPRPLPVSSYWSTLIFNFRLLKIAFIKYFLTNVEQDLILRTNDHIKNTLSPLLYIIYNSRTLTCIWEKMNQLVNKSYPYLKFLFNETRRSPCGVQGVKITGPNPSIGAFHDTLNDDEDNRKSSKIRIFSFDADDNDDEKDNKTKITDLVAEIKQTLCVTYDKKPIHVGTGLKLTAELLPIPLIQDLVWTLNILRKNEALESFLASDVNDEIANFVKTGKNPSGKIGFDGAFDMMGHINKGVLALRFGSTKDIYLCDITVSNIKNFGKPLDQKSLCYFQKNWQVNSIDITSDTFLSPMNYHGSYAMGSIFSGCEDATLTHLTINTIEAPHGAAVGLAINNVCEHIKIDDSYIYGLFSCSSCFDSATFVIDQKSTCIRTENLHLNPALGDDCVPPIPPA